jgi:transglutaminase-like putative cysteine protease
LDDDSGAYTALPHARDLAFTRLTAPDSAISAIAAGAGPDPAGICSGVHTALAYEHGVTAVTTTAADALAAGRGVCQDYAHVMLSVCRLVGIPARYVSGHLLGEGGSHAWVEVFRRRRGREWSAEAWDPANNCRTGAGYITIAVGRDYADVAPMSGMYEGSGVTGTLTVSKQVRETDLPAPAKNAALADAVRN